MAENTALRSIKRWLWKGAEGKFPNADVFSRLYEDTHLIAFRYIYGLIGGPFQEVGDLTAETFARAWNACHRYNGNGQAALGWLLQIAKNLVIDLSRRRKNRDTEEVNSIELLVDPAQIPEADVITREQIAILWKMLGMLNTDVRGMAVLRYMLGWQVRQIARHRSLDKNTVVSKIKSHSPNACAKPVKPPIKQTGGRMILCTCFYGSKHMGMESLIPNGSFVSPF